MDIGKLAELIVYDCRFSIKTHSHQPSEILTGDYTPSYRQYLAYIKKEKRAEELTPVVSGFLQGLTRVRNYVINDERTLTVLPSPDEVAQALELARSRIEDLFKQYEVI